MFFAEGGRNSAVLSGTRRAKEICRGCPVNKECLKFALDYEIPFGIFGGLTSAERVKLTR